MCVLIKFEMKIISFSLCVFFKHKWNDDEVEQSIITWITHKHVSMPFLKNELFHHKHVFVFLKLFQSIQQTNITHFILNITRDWSFHTEFHFTLLTINLILNILEYLQLCNNISNLGMFCCFPSQTCGVWKKDKHSKIHAIPSSWTWFIHTGFVEWWWWKKQLTGKTLQNTWKWNGHERWSECWQWVWIDVLHNILQSTQNHQCGRSLSYPPCVCPFFEIDLTNKVLGSVFNINCDVGVFHFWVSLKCLNKLFTDKNSWNDPCEW